MRLVVHTTLLVWLVSFYQNDPCEGSLCTSPCYQPLPCLSSCPDFLHAKSEICNCKQDKLFLPLVALGHGLYHSNRKRSRTVPITPWSLRPGRCARPGCLAELWFVELSLYLFCGSPNGMVPQLGVSVRAFWSKGQGLLSSQFQA